MSTHDMEKLDQELRSLKDDVPPMPVDFHAGWMKQVEEDTMQKQSKRTAWTRILSVAAALVFVIGGTLLTRDDLAPRQSETQEYGYTTGNYGTSIGYSMRAAGNSASYESSYDTDMIMMAKTTSDMAAVPEEAAVEKKIIRTASLNITTQQFDESLALLRQLCEEKGGWISYSHESTSGNRRTASLTMRIPSGELDVFLAGAGDTGRITQRSESADDVTDSYYDTKTRLETQQALMARLQALVTDAADLSDLLALESQIADTQYQIDRLQGQLNGTDRQVDYATVDISLREELPADSLTDVEKTLGERIADAIKTGWEAFTDFMSDMAVFLAAALPFIIVVIVVVIVVMIIRKRRRK